MFIKSADKSKSLVKPPISQRLKSGCVVLKKGEEVGEHVTENREEIIIVLYGEATVIVEGVDRKVQKGQIIFIPENKKHNVINQTNESLKYIYAVSLLG